METIYDQLKKVRVPLDFRGTDLYVLVTPQSQLIIDNHKPKIDPDVIMDKHDHQTWFKIPLEYATNNKLSTEALKESEPFNAGLLNNTPDPMFVTNAKTSIQFVNPAFEKLTGYSSFELIGRKIPYPWWPDDQIQMLTAVADTAKYSELVSEERCFRKKSGEYFWVSNKISHIKNKGEIRYFLINWIDITDRKKTEDALRESEAFSASLLKDAPNPIIVTNLDSSIRYVNPAFEKLTGYSFKEVVGLKSPYPWWPPEIEKQLLEENISGKFKDINSRERKYRNRNGEYFWISTRISHVKNNGETQYYLGNWVDISERKKAEEALKESEQRYRLLFENMNDGYAYCQMVFENEQPRDFVYLAVNKSFEILTGLKDVAGKKVTGVIPGIRETNPELFQIYGKVAATGQPERFETYVDPLKIWLSISVYSIEKGTFTAIFENITERKKAEEELKLAAVKLEQSYQKEKVQREELQEEAKARGMFIDILAHELRTPLTPILASIGMLQELFENQPDGLPSKLVRNIFDSSQNLAQRLDELLELARYSRGTFKLQIQQGDISEFLAEAASRFKPTLDQKGQQLVLALANNLPVVEFDRSRLEQVIVNLLSNASKFSPLNGKITLRAQREIDGLRVEIQDEGVGISPDEQKRLFQPYHRVEQDRKKFPGTGLGLAVCKLIIEAHGGEIGVTSEQGHGSTFSFRIPLKKSN